jgi:multidrug efflux pump subunit AcrA (membrane-fusion protein)
MERLNKSCMVFLLTAAAISIFSCRRNETESDNAVEVKTAVSFVSPSIQSITENITLNGVTVFQKKNNIRSINTGYITSLKFKPGDEIKTGQVFCTIGTKEQEALKNISAVDSSLEKFQKPIAVYANGSGVITSISVVQGDYVSEGDILAGFSEPSSLIVRVNVPYEYNKFVSTGKMCEILLPDGKNIHTAISGEMPSVDATSQAQTYFIRLPDERLPENLNVTIHISKNQKNNLLCVPTIAIQTDEMQRQFWVMKIFNDTLAVKIPVTTGLQNDSLTEIISDEIKPGDKIITQGAYGLADSSLVITAGHE